MWPHLEGLTLIRYNRLHVRWWIGLREMGRKHGMRVRKAADACCRRAFKSKTFAEGRYGLNQQL